MGIDNNLRGGRLAEDFGERDRGNAPEAMISASTALARQTQLITVPHRSRAAWSGMARSSDA